MYKQEDQSDQGLNCLPFCMQHLKAFLYSEANWFQYKEAYSNKFNFFQIQQVTRSVVKHNSSLNSANVFLLFGHPNIEELTKFPVRIDSCLK